MPSKFKLMKTKWYPRPHDMQHQWTHGLETALVNQYTIYPFMMYDEGQASPSAYEANPAHASFTVAAEPGCFPDSTIDSIFAEIEFNLTKAALVTDALHAVKVCFMPIHMSFLEDGTAIDELSTDTILDILHLQTETTDRQTYPLFNAVDMDAKTAAYNVLSNNVPGLT